MSYMFVFANLFLYTAALSVLFCVNKDSITNTKTVMNKKQYKTVYIYIYIYIYVCVHIFIQHLISYMYRKNHTNTRVSLLY